MDYIQISVRVSNADAIDFVIADMQDKPVESIEVKGLNVLAYVPKDQYEVITTDDFPLGLSKGPLKIETLEIPHQNWNINWESNFSPVYVENQVLVKAPFHSGLDTNKYQYLIEINPKMAFGTGHHPTTYLMIQELLKRDLKGKQILDMGCGTGVLTVLAVKMGAIKAIGIEIDPYSAENALEVIHDNNVSDNSDIYLGGAELISSAGIAYGSYDYILANINRNTLLSDMDSYANNSYDGTLLHLSGFYLDDVDKVLERAKDCGYFLVSQSSKEGWIHLTLNYRSET